jgi:hypothetical protein
MALLTKWLGTDLWGAIQGKNDNLVDAVNEFAGGTIGQRLVKSSSTDFDVEYANPENIAKYTGSAFALNGFIVGDAYNFTTIHSTFVGNANQLVKIYSLSNPNKSLIAQLESSTTSTNLVGRIQFNSDNSDTTSLSDWVIVPYNYTLSVFNSDVQSTFVANELFSALTLSGCTLSEYNINTFKDGRKVSFSGYLKVVSTGIAPDVYFTLKDKYFIANGDSYNFVFGSSCQLQNGATFTSIASWLSNLSVGETNSKSILRFLTNSTVANGNTLIYRFSFDYVASTYSI